MSTGFDYSTGKYGTATSTNILYIPVIAKYETDSLTLKLTVPYIRVTGTGNVVRGIGSFGNAITGTTSTTQSGLGDVTAVHPHASGEHPSILTRKA